MGLDEISTKAVAFWGRFKNSKPAKFIEKVEIEQNHTQAKYTLSLSAFLFQIALQQIIIHLSSVSGGKQVSRAMMCL